MEEEELKLLLFNLVVLFFFVVTKSAQALLLDDLGGARGHFDFQPETLQVLPFVMQVTFYTCQTCWDYGLHDGLYEIKAGFWKMKPAIVFSICVSAGSLIQTYAQGLMNSTDFIVMVQLGLVFTAMYQRVLLQVKSPAAIWSLVFLMFVCVSAYQLCGAKTPPPATKADPVADGTESTNSLLLAAASDDVVRSAAYMGPVVLITALAINQAGCVLQQQFVQMRAPEVPVSVKLGYQHLIGLGIMLSSATLKPSCRHAILEKGFLYGWNWEVLVASLITWSTYLVGSTCCAYISAMAASMGTAFTVMCIGLVGVLEGKPTTVTQMFLMLAVVCITLCYAWLKDLLNRKAIREQTMSKDHRFTTAILPEFNRKRMKGVHSWPLLEPDDFQGKGQERSGMVKTSSLPLIASNSQS